MGIERSLRWGQASGPYPAPPSQSPQLAARPRAIYKKDKGKSGYPLTRGARKIDWGFSCPLPRGRRGRDGDDVKDPFLFSKDGPFSWGRDHFRVVNKCLLPRWVLGYALDQLGHFEPKWSTDINSLFCKYRWDHWPFSAAPRVWIPGSSCALGRWLWWGRCSRCPCPSGGFYRYNWMDPCAGDATRTWSESTETKAWGMILNLCDAWDCCKWDSGVFFWDCVGLWEGLSMSNYTRPEDCKASVHSWICACAWSSPKLYSLSPF